MLARWLKRGPADAAHAPGRRMEYDKAKRLASDANPTVRRKLAARADVQPEILYFLASDTVPEVRREIARNRATPRQADLVLARDRDEEVRTLLAHKVARLAPHLSPSQRSRVEELTLEVVETLAEDQLPRIRRIVAEEIKHLDNLPKRLIDRLARDVELAVCAPVLEFSPLLTDDDLLEIIASPPVKGALSAISRRFGLGAAVADAIVEADVAEAVAELLANSSAQIREETLDRIIDRAPANEPWHAPLVERPELSQRAVQRIARFVTASLLAVLEKRHGLDPATTRKVAERVGKRLSADGHNADGLPEDRALRLYEEGRLDEACIAGALTQGDRAFIVHSLALRAGIAPEVVGRILKSKSGRAVTALCWKAGLSMRAALQVQLRGARVPPPSLVNAKDGVHYPFTPEEMEEHLALVAG